MTKIHRRRGAFAAAGSATAVKKAAISSTAAGEKEAEILRVIADAAHDNDVTKGDALLILFARVALAAMAQSKAELSYLKACESIGGDTERLKADRLAAKDRKAQREACAAGAALAKALRGVK